MRQPVLIHRHSPTGPGRHRRRSIQIVLSSLALPEIGIVDDAHRESPLLDDRLKNCAQQGLR
ncbi:MAG: hypothetical protein R3F37_13860 [Candidatus Competibacteraceae bacterium]